MAESAKPALEAHPLRLLVFSASRRAESYNSRLARLAAHHAGRFGAIVRLATMQDFDVPMYDGDVDARAGAPPGAQLLNRLLTESDAFVISSPEYNGAMPGILKNLIDWTSRIRPQPFHERHALLLSASPSLSGGKSGLWSLRVPLEHLGARVFPDMFSLAMAHKAFSGDGLADATLQKRFENNLRAFLDLAEAAKNYPCIKKAWVEFLGEPSGSPADRVEEGESYSSTRSS
jgi:chromate reductase